MGKGSQKLDIEDIRDALIGGIGLDGSALSESLAGENANPVQVEAQEMQRQTILLLREIVAHLRIITNETPGGC